jgi:hypothetical protein
MDEFEEMLFEILNETIRIDREIIKRLEKGGRGF